MPEWLIERGIGEERALLLDDGSVLAAKLHWPGDLRLGSRISAKLVSKTAGSRRGMALTENGSEVLVDRLPASVTEGESLALRITRAAIAERGRLKRPVARLIDQKSETPATTDDPFSTGTTTRRFPLGSWEEVWQAASSGEVDFPGGSLLFSVTPAMTVVDVDGVLAPRDLALAAVPALARALRLFDLGGSIGIDFPTLQLRADRKAVDEALDEALAGWPHERTAMNGFGFVQIVARLEGPSLLHRFATARVGAAARMALRAAEMIEGAGATLLTVHPALKSRLRPDWQEQLVRRTGRPLRIDSDPGLAIEAPAAQIVAHDC